jgi:hypothetical protein
MSERDDERSRMGVDDLITAITDHLAETDADYRAEVSARLGLHGVDDDRATRAIAQALTDAPPSKAVELANALLSGGFELESDGSIAVTPVAEPGALAP